MGVQSEAFSCDDVGREIINVESLFWVDGPVRDQHFINFIVRLHALSLMRVDPTVEALKDLGKALK